MQSAWGLAFTVKGHRAGQRLVWARARRSPLPGRVLGRAARWTLMDPGRINWRVGGDAKNRMLSDKNAFSSPFAYQA